MELDEDKDEEMQEIKALEKEEEEYERNNLSLIKPNTNQRSKKPYK